MRWLTPQAMRVVTAWFILIAPAVILLTDLMVYLVFGHTATITGVVRQWDRESPWPRFIYVVGCVVLFFHFFTGWPEKP